MYNNQLGFSLGGLSLEEAQEQMRILIDSKEAKIVR